MEKNKKPGNKLVYSQLIYNKEAKTIQWGKDGFINKLK